MKKLFTQAYKKMIFNLSAQNSILFLSYYKYFYKPAKGSLACFYDKVSKHLDNTFVIQVGANDGINHDPIHKYIKRDRWKGVLVEPQPDVFRNQLFPLYLIDKGIYMENIAISDEIGLMDMYKISFTTERWATGLTTFNKPTLEAKVDNGDIDTISKRKKIKVPAKKSDYINQVKVETKTFDFLRAKYQIAEVDVLQIDVEGFDFEVIKLYDLSKNKPKVIVFESRHLTEIESSEAEAYFIEHSFTVKKIKGDSIVVRNDFKFGMDLLNDY
ncbi:FkbM family methyltransferase [Marivirga sp. S37H4]|uniref:FkbM family methyltransferase n=1 Tax=Marivirga aurantiaca TaxID=2802615 RepID=A0A934X1D3_9BACT|nr:FkbM family methyltransferase [Marivirga aurantiaca]MBK6267188.1 FkbM family methyltransferase [Marivirga aurantiaca]